MKRYYNKTSNSWYTEGTTLTLSTGNSLFSGIPTEEQLKEWGYVEHVDPTPEPLSEEVQAYIARQNRMKEILSELNSMDYLTSKYIDGEDMSKYGDWQSERKALREEYNALEDLQKAYQDSLNTDEP